MTDPRPSLPLAPLDGRLTLKGSLGSGGMGEVHRAWDAGLERPVAVKFVKGGDPKEADRLLLEARLQARIEHPHVVRVHDTGTLEGRPCIVMQLVEGRTFADLGREADWRTKVALAAQAARGLGAAHRMGLIHRDVKPANILVEDSEDGPQARLSDFGLARDEEGGLTRSGLLMGSVDFMAPEQVTGAVPVDFRADVYGLGATLYAVLAGRPPFRNSLNPTAAAQSTQDLDGATEGADLHPGDLLRRVLEEEPKPLISEVPGLPKDLTVVVAKAMEKEPARRYATAEALADDLERVLRGEAIQARPMGWLERVTRWSRRNPIPARAVGTALLAILAATAFAVWNGRRSTLEALNAAQLGGEAKAFELRLKMAHLAPAHDLRPVHAELRAGLGRLAGRGGGGSPAADYARGQVLLLLGDLDEARAALELALGKGFKGEGLHEALGLAYGRLYERARSRVEALEDAELRVRQLAKVDSELKAPAVFHLKAAGESPSRMAFLALLDHQFETCRHLARQARERDPEALDATLLEVQAWYQESHEAFRQREWDRAARCAREGLERGAALLDELRSDPAVPLVLAHLKEVVSDVEAERGGNPEKTLLEGLGWVDRALSLDQDSSAAWLARARLLGIFAKVEANRFEEGAGKRMEAYVEASRRALALAPRRGDMHAQLSMALGFLGQWQFREGKPFKESFLEGRQEGLEAFRLEPWNPMALHSALLLTIREAGLILELGERAEASLVEADRLLQLFQAMKGVHPRYALGARAELKVNQAKQAWLAGQDPNPLYEEALGLHEALVREEPDSFIQVSNLLSTSQAWSERRWAAGQEVETLLLRVTPYLDEAVRKWPENKALCDMNRAALLVTRIYGPRGGRPSALDPMLIAETQKAIEAAYAATHHPVVRSLLGYVELARARVGVPGAAHRACAPLEQALKGFPNMNGPRHGLAYALHLRARLGDHDRALRLLDEMPPAFQTDPEWAVFRSVVLGGMGRVEEATQVRNEVLARQPLVAGHPAWASIGEPIQSPKGR